MDEERARKLVSEERTRVKERLNDTLAAASEDRAAADEPGDMTDPEVGLTAEEGDDAVVEELRHRLESLDRAERRIEAGTFGLSVRSGRAIPDDRLEADPAAELTVEEAERE